MGDVVTGERDLGRRQLGQSVYWVDTREKRAISWHCGDMCATDVCKWASARADGLQVLTNIVSVLTVSNKFGDEARRLVAEVMLAVDPSYSPIWDFELFAGVGKAADGAQGTGR